MNTPLTTSGTVRAATESDADAMQALMPRLAAFDIPQWRTARHLWMHDAELLRQWLVDKRDDILVQVAENGTGQVTGCAMTTLRPELLSREPSAHLEAIAVAEGLEGQGTGRLLLQAAEREARERGAGSMTLHVFAVNTRARGFYERMGYTGELMRYIKRFDD